MDRLQTTYIPSHAFIDCKECALFSCATSQLAVCNVHCSLVQNLYGLNPCNMLSDFVWGDLANIWMIAIEHPYSEFVILALRWHMPQHPCTITEHLPVYGAVISVQIFNSLE